MLYGDIYIPKFSYISPSEITSVLVWGILDGKKGWWKAELNDAGEVILKPTDNMTSVNTQG